MCSSSNNNRKKIYRAKVLRKDCDGGGDWGVKGVCVILYFESVTSE